MMRFSRAITFVLSAIVLPTQRYSGVQAASDDELGEAAGLFSGPLEVIAEHPEFVWLEGPLWSDSGQYLIFSDVKWADERGYTCGMLWKWSESNGVEKLLKCAGLVGPGDNPENLADYIEAGANGKTWGWDGEGDLVLCQHGKSRVVRFNIEDIKDETIDPDLVTVLADKWNGIELDAPNDMMLYENDLYFTDPPFGLQFFGVEDPLANAYDVAPLNPSVYKIVGEEVVASTGGPVNPSRMLFFDKKTYEAPNGIVVVDDEIICPITNFEDPRAEIFAPKIDGDKSTSNSSVYDAAMSTRLETKYRIQGENADTLPALTDGSTYSPELGVLFVAGPGGVYMYDAEDTYNLLGFLRINDLVSNVDVGGGYLWITANQRVMRAPLVVSPVDKDSSTACSFLNRSILVGIAGASVALLV